MSFGRALTRGLPRGRRVSLPRPRLSLRSRFVRRLLIVVVLVGALLLGAWLWVRDSSLVAVTKVTVTGATGPDAGAIRSALVGAARAMTTLDVNMARLRSAVSPFPVVSEVRATTQFPHGIRIRVVERPPVAMVTIAGKNIAVAGDGTLLHDMAVSAPLPLIPLTVPPGGPRLTGPALQSARLLAAAPDQLIPKIAQISSEAGHGLVAQLRGGPKIYFGNGSSARAKWLAASAVLADNGSPGASYIDVTDPVRAAAGAGSQSGSTTSSSSGSGNTGSGNSGNTGSGNSGNSGTGNSGNTGSGNSGGGGGG
jgi:cell division protein FtsQ